MNNDKKAAGKENRGAEATNGGTRMESLSGLMYAEHGSIVVDGHVVVPQGQLLEDLLNRPDLLAPPVMVIPGLAAAGRITMFYSREKIGKSTLLAFAAARVSTGGQLFEVDVAPNRVLWVGLEEPLSDAVRRFERMGGDPKNIVLVSRLNGLRQLKAEILAAKPDVVIVDSLAAFATDLQSENDASAVQSILQPPVQFVHDTNVATILVHHSNKSEAGGYRGSVAIGAAMDMLIELSADEADTSVRHLRPKGRFELAPFSVRYFKETGTFVAIGRVAPAVEPVIPLDDRIVEFVRRCRDNATMGKATKEAIRGAMGGKAATTDRAISKLIEEGRIRRGGHLEGYLLVFESDPQQSAGGAVQLDLGADAT